MTDDRILLTCSHFPRPLCLIFFTFCVIESRIPYDYSFLHCMSHHYILTIQIPIDWNISNIYILCCTQEPTVLVTRATRFSYSLFYSIKIKDKHYKPNSTFNQIQSYSTNSTLWHFDIKPIKQGYYYLLVLLLPTLTKVVAMIFPIYLSLS